MRTAITAPVSSRLIFVWTGADLLEANEAGPADVDVEKRVGGVRVGERDAVGVVFPAADVELPGLRAGGSGGPPRGGRSHNDTDGPVPGHGAFPADPFRGRTSGAVETWIGLLTVASSRSLSTAGKQDNRTSAIFPALFPNQFR